MGASNGMNSAGAGLYWALFAAPEPTSLADIEAGNVWNELSDIKSINGVALDVSVTDVTHLRSPQSFKEKVAGFVDAGQTMFGLNYFKGVMTALIGLSPGSANAPRTSPASGRLQFAAVFPDDGVWVLTGFIKSQPFEVPEDGGITVQVTVEISGPPTWFAFA